MPKLESALISLHALGRPAAGGRITATALLAVTLVYLVAVLSVPLYAPQRIVWLAVYPVVSAEMSGIGFGRVFVKSLWVLPLVALIGMFNPMIDTETAFTVGGVAVSRGWVSFTSIALRGMLAVQAVLVLTLSAGFFDMCDSMRRLGCPRVLVTQMQFTYRYMIVVIEEALGMDRARKSRGFGRKSYPLGMWGRMVGQLFVRSYERAGRIHRAMLSRGFDGTMPTPSSAAPAMNARSWTYLALWTAVIVALRLLDFRLISCVAP